MKEMKQDYAMYQYTGSYRYTINGKIIRILKYKWGNRQGSHISPILFVLVMEYLHGCLAKLQEKPDYKFCPMCVRLKITNICFEDDLLLFARGDIISKNLMMLVFNQFSAYTRFKANPNKCKEYFGGTNNLARARILRTTGFEEGNLPFKYVGVPLTFY